MNAIPCRKGFEVLLRKLLSYPKAPAVVILHWWSPGTQVHSVEFITGTCNLPILLP